MDALKLETTTHMLTHAATLISKDLSVAPRKKPTITLPPYVRCVKSRGREYFYFHAARGTKAEQKAVRLPDDPRLPEWWEEYRRLSNAPSKKPLASSVQTLVEAYQASPAWSQLSDSTRVNWQLYFDRINARWGELQVRGIEPKHVLALRDRFAKTPAAANNLLRCLSSLLSWSIPRGWRTDNPCLFVPKLKIGEGYEAWPWEMIELLEREGPPWMWQAAALALYTGQRQGDVLAMTRAKIKNGFIEVKQEKTGKELRIPAHRELLAVLTTMRPDSVQILTNTRGLPWTQNGFRASWKKSLKGPLAAIREEGLVFHGLRKSSVVMLLEAGATEAEVAAVTGQSMQMVAHYAKQVSQRRLASSAILKWERAKND